jgi:hypothetical protein
MTKRNITIVPAVFVVGFVIASFPAKAADVADNEQVSKLLSEAKTTAFLLKEDAAAMENYTRMTVSRESQAAAINQVREHVNSLGRLVARLNDARGIASPWQRTAIDRINPFLDELGGYTSAIIEYFNRDPKHTFDQYKDYLEANADYSADLAAMIANFVDYGRTKQRLERLTGKLEVPTTK